MIDFDFKSLNEISTLAQYYNEIKESTTNVISQIIAVTEQRTFNNTVQPIITLQTMSEPKLKAFHYVANFYPNKELIEYASERESDIKKFMIEQMMQKEFYLAYDNYMNNYYQIEKQTLTNEENRLFNNTMRDFKRCGLHLDEPDLTEVKEMKKQISEMCTKFKTNVNMENTSFIFTKKELDGMPENWFTEDRTVTKDTNNPENSTFKVTLKYPDYIPAIEYIKSDCCRKKLYIAYSTRCNEDNTPLFEKVVKLRYILSQKLGYANHADYATEVKIVKSGQNAYDFEMNLNDTFRPIYNKETDDVLEFAKNNKELPLNKSKFDPWDRPLYNRMYKEYLCNLDMNSLKAYFPIDTVRDGIFQIYQRILGLVFEKINTENKWHESVELFSVRDSETNELMGYFYLDMFPRENKFSHAAAFDFQTGCDMTKINGSTERRPHIMTMACNFPKDNTGISFRDVETFFHEFGHIMHQICSKPQLTEFSGFGVEWDFVEAPSQMLENWCYSKEPLQMMSKPALPDDIVENLIKSKKVLVGYNTMRQLMFGIFDLRIHMMAFDSPDAPFDVKQIWHQVEQEVLGYTTPDECNPAASFGHLMGGYDAGYYGYLRSETYAANMFYKWFKGGNELNKESGMRYRKLLLEPGSTKDGIEILRDFLDEEPNDIYYLIDCGLEAIPIRE